MLLAAVLYTVGGLYADDDIVFVSRFDSIVGAKTQELMGIRDSVFPFGFFYLTTGILNGVMVATPGSEVLRRTLAAATANVLSRQIPLLSINRPLAITGPGVLHDSVRRGDSLQLYWKVATGKSRFAAAGGFDLAWVSRRIVNTDGTEDFYHVHTERTHYSSSFTAGGGGVFGDGPKE